MAVDALLTVLERAAAAEADAVLARAGTEAEAIVAAAVAEGTRREALARERLAAEERAAVQRETAAVARAHRERWLAARAAVLERIFRSAGDRLHALDSTRYQPLLPALADEALAYLEGRPAVVKVPGASSRLVERHLAGREVQVEPDADTGPGVLARSADGTITVDNRLAARLARQEADLAIELVRRIGESVA